MPNQHFNAPTAQMHNPYTQYANYGSSNNNNFQSAPVHTASNNNGGGGGGGNNDLDNFSFPEIKNDADLAMFNQFMISLGRDAAVGPSLPNYNNVPMTHTGSFNSNFSTSSISSGSPLSDQSPIEDLFNPDELASLGLAGMPGIPMLPPAALPQTIAFGNMYPSLDATRSRASSNPDLAMNDFTKRAIAGLPRNHSLSTTPPHYPQQQSSSMPFMPSYPELPMGHAYKPSAGSDFDFDSLVRSKPAVGATIQPRDFHKKTYRHVAPLGAAVSSRFKMNESSLRTELDVDEDEIDEDEYEANVADSPDQMETPKISIRSLLTADDLPDGPNLILPAIHSPHDDEHHDLPSVRDIEGYRPPVKRHTEDDMVRAVKRLELDEGGRRGSVDLSPQASEVQGDERDIRRRHAALIRAWLVAVNLDYRTKRLEKMGEAEQEVVEV